MGKRNAKRSVATAPAMNNRPVSAYLSGGSQPIFLPGDPQYPAGGLADQSAGPRQFDYSVGVNAIPGPRPEELISFEELRNLARYYEGIQIAEGLVIGSLQRLKMRVVLRPEYADGTDGATAAGDAMAEWFAEPDHNRHSLPSWLAAAERDLIELDALGVYHRRDASGRLYGLDLVAGDTIAPLIDVQGRVPDAPAPAYTQVLKGLVASLWTRDELDYLVEHPRTDSPYGLSRVERVVMAVNRALRKEHYDLQRFTEGSMPLGTMETIDPKLLGMDADKFQKLERQWNTMLAGNVAARMRVRFIPPGWSYKPQATEDITTEFDRWLLNLTCASFGLTMDEMGFTETSNRSVGDSQERVVKRNSTRPRAEYWARYFDRVIRRNHGEPLAPNARALCVGSHPLRVWRWDARYRVVWEGLEDPDEFGVLVGQAATMVQAGIMAPDEARAWLKIPRGSTR